MKPSLISRMRQVGRLRTLSTTTPNAPRSSNLNISEPLFVPCAKGAKARVLHLDKQFIVVSKPNGVLSQPDFTGDESLDESVSRFLKSHYDKPGNAFVAVVHRLDRPASGVTVLATTSKAASRLAQQVRERKVRKDYLAVVPSRNLGNKADGTIEGKEGQESDLIWKEIFSVENGKFSILHVKIETGSKHQIRRQLAESGIGPVIGDMRYHSTVRTPEGFPASKGIMLHASRLSFAHPTRPEERVIVACPPPWPNDFMPRFYREPPPSSGRDDGRRQNNDRRGRRDDRDDYDDRY